MFTVFLSNAADIWEGLLAYYFPRGGKILDFTYGTGALWWNIYEKNRVQKYEITKTDAKPTKKVLEEGVLIRDLTHDNYSDFGLHDAALFDPPYLIGRKSFDYSSKVLSSNISGDLIALQYQGKRSWAANNLENYVANPTVDAFNARVEALNRVAPTVLKEKGLLFGRSWIHGIKDV